MLLIAAAVMAEIEPLVREYDFEPFREAGFYHHRRQPVLVAALGIGLVEFIAGLALLLKEYGVSRALLTGSCGVYPGSLSRWPPGCLVRPAGAILGDPAAAAGRAYFPAPLECRSDFTGGEALLPGDDDPAGNCLTLAAITSSQAAARRLEQFYRADFEQMEAFAFARLCRRSGIPAAALFAVVNEVGDNSHRQWLAGARAGAEKCAARLGERLALG